MTSFDISLKFTLFRGHKWGHVIIHFDPQFYPLMHPKQSKFGWYIKSCHLCIFPTSHVTYSLKITFLPCFIGRWARFYTFWPPILPQYTPKQGKFWWYIKRYQLHILPTSHVTYSLKITFLPCFIGRWARFYTFWPPVLPQYTPKQGKFWWYIERHHLHILPFSHVTYSLKMTFIPCFIGRWVRFYPFWPPSFSTLDSHERPKTKIFLFLLSYT